MKKLCRNCKKEFDISNFYKHKGTKDGYLNECKFCRTKKTKKYRLENIEKVKAYDRQRGLLPHRLKANRERNLAVNLTSEQKLKRDISRKKWLDNNKIKRACHVLLNNAVKNSVIDKPNKCSICGNCDITICGHHEDYNKPLDVIWMCCGCHAKTHKRISF